MCFVPFFFEFWKKTENFAKQKSAAWGCRCHNLATGLNLNNLKQIRKIPDLLLIFPIYYLIFTILDKTGISVDIFFRDTNRLWPAEYTSYEMEF